MIKVREVFNQDKDDISLSFSMSLPSDWRARDDVTEMSYSYIAKKPEKVWLFAGDDPDVWVSVALLHLDREAHPLEWVLSELTNPPPADDLLVLEMPEGRVAEIPLSFQVDKSTYVSRIKIFRNEARLFVIAGTAIERKSMPALGVMITALASFRLLNPREGRFAEQIEEVNFEVPGSQQTVFVRPQSWTMKEMTSPDPRVLRYFEFLNCSKLKESGYIRFQILSKSPETDARALLEERIFQRFEAERFLLSWDEVNELITENNGGMAVTEAELSAQDPDGIQYSISAGLKEYEGAWALAYLMTPRKENEPRNWAINDRVFNLFFRSIKFGTDHASAPKSEPM